ncbi:MAG: hypothetical protein GC155_18245 [Alphaproteobacteria bacterium]|nr:hypothetical protein [Alphaproteobacteria bacterium]
MEHSANRLSRRGFGLGLAAFAVLAPSARAANRFPMRIGYMRMGPKGFLATGSREQHVWSAMQTRLGGLLETIQPIQPTGLTGEVAPDVDGAASCAIAARGLAAERGLGYVILYATQEGHKAPAPGKGWFARAFSSLRSSLTPHDQTTGEAYLLNVAGGPPIASATANLPQKSLLNPFDNARDPGRETLVALRETLERRLQELATPELKANASMGH